MHLLRLYHTLRHLRRQQWLYRLYYPLKKTLYRPRAASSLLPAEPIKHDLPAIGWRQPYQPGDNTFNFLNRSHAFGERIDWNFRAFGLLWTYHLNYWEWLEDASLPADLCLRQMIAYARDAPAAIRNEPYPASLRLLHWIRFCLRHRINDPELIRSMQRDTRLLQAFPEYQLQGNHLLENAFALWHAAHFFNDPSLAAWATKFLRRELQVQILPDGGHCERSAMYHAQLLLRLLHCIAIGGPGDKGTGLFLCRQAALMLGWLQAYAFRDGSVACIGDATTEEIPPLPCLMGYAASLSLRPLETGLKESGYRKYQGKSWEALIQAGGPAPAWQPGHAHADTFTYCLQYLGKPLIADTGISTYGRNERRLQERGTAAHNTLTAAGRNSSEVWASFRVGRQARVLILEENQSYLRARHDGYRLLGIEHERTFVRQDHQFRVCDRIEGDLGLVQWQLHFHPGVRIEQKDASVFEAAGVRIRLQGLKQVQLVPYDFAAGYNHLLPAQKLTALPEDRNIVTLFEFSV